MNSFEEDDVDKALSLQSGKIERPMGRLCIHASNTKCLNCLPLECFEVVHNKHMSFHTFLRKTSFTLENCFKDPIVLAQQRWRQLDNVDITSLTVENFIDGWRQTGLQRVGLLIGVYEQFLGVPLGIRARVYAVYEPVQSSGAAEVRFGDDPKVELLERLLRPLGMRVVGWMFTDLWTKDARTGSVHCIRNQDSFLLSAQEIITAASLQLKHPNITRYCADGYFGSKFVTVVVSGDPDEQVHLSGYQVSNQCMEMVKAQMLCPTRDYPELAWVKKPIPEVQYMEKNEYGLIVRRNGRLLPVEFFLVDVPVGGDGPESREKMDIACRIKDVLKQL